MDSRRGGPRSTSSGSVRQELRREWLEGIRGAEAAKPLGVTRAAHSRVLNGKTGISAEMDLRLAKALGTTTGFWYAPLRPKPERRFELSWSASERRRWRKHRSASPVPR